MTPDDAETKADKTVRKARKDVAALHFPPVERKPGYEKGLGLEGYDRHTGSDVPKRPALRVPGKKEPVAEPFDRKKEPR